MHITVTVSKQIMHVDMYVDSPHIQKLSHK